MIEARARPSPFSPAARNARLIPATVITLLLGIGGCARQSPVYSWSHQASGEYLFAFDQQECSHAGLADETSVHASTASSTDPFMACMTERGYFLVDQDTGRPLAAALITEATGDTQAQR